MPAAVLLLKKIWRKAAALCAVGVALSLLRRVTLGMAPGAFLTDTLFTVASVFFCAGLIGLIKNLGMFNSMKYGTKSLIRMFRGEKQKPEDKMAGGYLEYVNSRPKTKDVPWLMGLSAVFLVLSVLCSLPLV